MRRYGGFTTRRRNKRRRGTTRSRRKVSRSAWTPSRSRKGGSGRAANPAGREQVEVAASQEALAELLEVMQAQGPPRLPGHGVRRQDHDPARRDRGKAFACGRSARLPRAHPSSGAREGQTGWVARAQLQHTGPDTRPSSPSRNQTRTAGSKNRRSRKGLVADKTGSRVSEQGAEAADMKKLQACAFHRMLSFNREQRNNFNLPIRACFCARLCI